MNANVDATISIVNWNTKDELRKCLRSVLSQCREAGFGSKPPKQREIEVIVVDNGSSDESADMVRSEFAGEVTLITSENNLGFAAAQNLSLRRSSGRYVLLLNPDSKPLQPDALQKMVEFMDANPDIGMLGPRITNPDGSLQYSARQFPTMLAALFRHPAFSRIFPKNRFVRRYMMLDFSHEEMCDVDWLSGAALMVRRETFERIGLLDERFFMYCEDVDWCRRAHAGGWRVVYFPQVSVQHRIGAASDLNPVAMIKAHHASMLRYFLKYDARSPRIVLLPLVILALWLRSRSLIIEVRR